MSEEKKELINEELNDEKKELTQEELEQVNGGSGLSGGQRQRVALGGLSS